VTLDEQSYIYLYLFNCKRLKIDFVTQPVLCVSCKVVSDRHTSVVF